MSTMHPGLFVGQVVHQRLSPVKHHLSYGMFQCLLDIDAIDETVGPLRSMSHNRFNLLSFYDNDHGPPCAQLGLKATLSQRLRAFLQSQDLPYEIGRIWLMSMPRLLGFVFNPISIYWIEDTDGALMACVYEVNNTFGDRHFYVLRSSHAVTGRLKQSCPKHMHVSPFMQTMGMGYDFDIITPSQRFGLKIVLKDKEEPVLWASFVARRMALTNINIMRQFWATPFMTFKVVAAIHWEAIKLIAKGLWLKPKPKTPKIGASLDQGAPISIENH